jgi:hypothetical protein
MRGVADNLCAVAAQDKRNGRAAMRVSWERKGRRIDGLRQRKRTRIKLLELFPKSNGAELVCHGFIL